MSTFCFTLALIERVVGFMSYGLLTVIYKVKIEDDVNHNHSSEKLGQEQDMSLFDSCQRKFFGSHKKGRDSPIRNNTPYKTTSKTKPSECTTSPLKQSTLNRVNFSPKGRRPGDLRLKQEQSTPYITPLYCAVPLRYSECAASVSYTFTENQMNSLQALKEEQFYKLILDTVVTFISQCRKPPASLVFYLFHNILLFGNSNLGPQCLRVLQEIQVLHPAVPAEMLRQKITWEYLSMVVDLSQCTQKSKSNSSHASSAFNSFMALTFLVIVMEGEVQRKTFSLVKTSAYRLLHAFKQSSHIHDIVFWIGRSVQQHPNVSSSCGYSCCPVFILQRFLHLSLLVSELPGESATRIADDLVLVYLKLQYLHHKTLFLQSFQSHLLRTKLIVVVISNICSSYTNQENRGYFCGGIRSFVTCMFQFSPPTNSSLSQDCSSVKPAKRGVCVDSCEEFIMLIAYWIQSYLFTRSRTLQKNTSDDMPKLSLDDVDVLMKLDEPVASFKMHLESLCSPLSTRSYQLLDLISSLKSCSAVKELSDFCA